MYSGMVDTAKVQEARRQLCVEAGFIEASDDKFRAYFQSYLKRKEQAGGELIVYGSGQSISERDSLLLQLKRKIKETLRRLGSKSDGH